MITRILFATALLSCSICGMARPRVRTQHFDPSRAVGCLLRHDWVKDDLKKLGLRPGNTALVRYRFGPIPGTSPNLPGQLQMIAYSPDRSHAWLFLIRVEGGERYIVIDNAYSLILSEGEWAAGEGNGGVATYAAIGKYATEISKERPLRVRLVANSRGCRGER